MSEHSLHKSRAFRPALNPRPRVAYAKHVDSPDPLAIPLALNLVAVFFGALGGVIRAGEDDRTDLVGVFTLAAARGFGGGIVRDMLLGNLPPAAFRDPLYFLVAGGATALGMLFLYYLRKLGPAMWALDSLIVGLFACVGVDAALTAGLGLLPAVIIGTIASVGGLLLCDLLQGRGSSIMYVGPPNALAGLAGALAYALVAPPTRPWIGVIVAVVVTLLARLTGPVLHLTVPQPRKHAYELRLRRRETDRKLRRSRRTRQPEGGDAL